MFPTQSLYLIVDGMDNLIFNKMGVFRENESFKRDPTIQRGQILDSLHKKHTMQDNKTTYIYGKLNNLFMKV